jgi:hypothetical protein
MNATDVLRSIEVDAERAIPQELVAMIADVKLMRPALHGEEVEYADALLLKLDQLIRDQQLEPLDRDLQESIASAWYAMPRFAIGGPAPQVVDEAVLSAA